MTYQPEANERTMLLQKLFIGVTTFSYLVIAAQGMLDIRQLMTKQLAFGAMIYIVVPIGYFVIADALQTERNSQISTIFRSLLAAIAGQFFWTSLIGLMRLARFPYVSYSHWYAVLTVISIAAYMLVLFILRQRKLW